MNDMFNLYIMYVELPPRFFLCGKLKNIFPRTTRKHSNNFFFNFLQQERFLLVYIVQRSNFPLGNGHIKIYKLHLLLMSQIKVENGIKPHYYNILCFNCRISVFITYYVLICLLNLI